MKIISISGASGSGKTTIAKLISKLYGTKNHTCNIISLDNYYLNEKQQIEVNSFCNYDHPNALDKELLVKNISELRNIGSSEIPNYSFILHDREGYSTINKSDILIIEGLYVNLFLEDIANIRIYVEADLDLLLARRILRDSVERGRTANDIIDQYIKFVRPAYFKYVTKQKSTSDIIIQNIKTIDDITETIIKELKFDT